ncbi:MAG: CAP domain-containing protein [Lachnotalea sp.]
MKKIAALGMIAITIAANIAPISVKAAGVTNYQCYGNNVVSSGYQCPTGTKAVVVNGNCNLDEIKSQLQEAGINSKSVNGVYSIDSQNCPNSADIIQQITEQANAQVAGSTTNCNLANNATVSTDTTSTDTTSSDAITTTDTTTADTTTADTTIADTTIADTTIADTTIADTTIADTTTADTTTADTNTADKTTASTTTASTTNDTVNTVNTNTQATTTNTSYAQQVVDLVNVERAKEGLTALTIDQNVVNAAMVRANEIQTKFEHVRPNGSPFVTALKENGVSYRGAGENIAWGQNTPKEVVNAWMNSPGHRANIMNPNFVHIGVGNLQNSAGTQYWVQIFTY